MLAEEEGEKSSGTEETSTSSEEEPLIGFLEPENLMIIGVKIEDIEVKALIDSGATKSLVKQKLVSIGQESNDGFPTNVIGLGGKG